MGVFSKYKFSPKLASEIMAFNAAGASLNSEYLNVDSGDVSSLPTACAFVEEQESIKKLVNLYIELVTKDATDFMELTHQVQSADQSQAGRLK